MESSHGLSVKAYSLLWWYYEQEYELWTIVTQQALTSMGGIMGSYSCIEQLWFERIYYMFLLWYDDQCNRYAYDLCFSIILKMIF